MLNVTRETKYMRENIDPNLKVFANNETGTVAFVTQFHLDKKEKLIEFINNLNKYCNYEKIEKAITREEALKHAQYLIDQEIYYYGEDDEGTPFNELPKKVQEKIGERCGWGRKWTKFTPESVIARDGWEEDEVFWVSLTKDGTYTYQLILKDGDYVSFIPTDERKFWPAPYFDGKIWLPNSSDWVEIKVA